MTQPASYKRVTSFTTDQAAAPSAQLSGANLDAELNGVKTTLDQILANLALIQRDDTHIANATVGRDQLDTTITLGFNAPTAWTTARNYVLNVDTVFNGANFYKCIVSHTSGVFATDLAALKWELIANFSASLANAVNVVFAPAQGLTSINVQAAIQETKVIVDDITGFRQDISGSYATSGNGAAYTLATGTPFASLAALDKQPVTFTPHTTCSGNPTLAVDSLAAKPLRTATGVNCTSASLIAGTPYTFIYYNSTNEFILEGYTETFNNVTVNGTLQTSGVVTIGATIIVTGAATFNSTAALGAGGSMAGTFTGNPTLSGNPTFSGSPTFSGKVSFTKTDTPLAIAGGTTGQRNGSPTEGDTRYNTTLHAVEYWNGTSWVQVGGAPRGWIDGLYLANNGTASINVAAGLCRSDDDTTDIRLTALITKSTAGTWVVGSGNNGLDTGTVANNTWYCAYAIYNPTTLVADVLLSASFSAPTMPSGYTKKRYLGAFQTSVASTTILAFTQVGDEFIWNNIVGISWSGSTTSSLVRLATPPLQVVARLRVTGTVNTTTATNFMVSCPDEADVLPNGNQATLSVTTTTQMAHAVDCTVRTNSSGQVRQRTSSATWASLGGSCHGWFDQRGKNV
jgi:hypothetical protein